MALPSWTISLFPLLLHLLFNINSWSVKTIALDCQTVRKIWSLTPETVEIPELKKLLLGTKMLPLSQKLGSVVTWLTPPPHLWRWVYMRGRVSPREGPPLIKDMQGLTARFMHPTWSQQPATQVTPGPPPGDESHDLEGRVPWARPSWFSSLGFSVSTNTECNRSCFSSTAGVEARLVGIEGKQHVEEIKSW